MAPPAACCYDGRPLDALPIATEGLALARRSGAPTFIVINLDALAMAVAGDDPERARALLHEATELSATLDYENMSELTQMTLVGATLADWPQTARLASRSLPHLHWTNDRPQLGGILNVAAHVLCDTDPDAAATILGATRTLAATSAPPAPATGKQAAPTTTTPTNPASPTRTASGESARGGLIVELRRETTRRLIDTLGETRLHELRDHGTLMDTDQAVAYALTHLDTYLTRHGNT